MPSSDQLRGKLVAKLKELFQVDRSDCEGAQWSTTSTISSSVGAWIFLRTDAIFCRHAEVASRVQLGDPRGAAAAKMSLASSEGRAAGG